MTTWSVFSVATCLKTATQENSGLDAMNVYTGLTSIAPELSRITTFVIFVQNLHIRT